MKTKMIVMILTGTLFLSINAMSSNDTILVSRNACTPNDTIVPPANDFIFQEEIAEFSGGDTALENYFDKQIEYPELAKHQGIEGKVVASFIINEYGRIENVTILNSIGGNCDEEVIYAIENMPAWKPAVQAGHKIRTRKLISVEFKF